LDWLENDNAAAVFDRQRQQHLAVVAYGIDSKAFETHWNAANELMLKVYNHYFPWDKTESHIKKTAETLRQRWVEAYGDPADPVVQEKIRNTAKAITETVARKRKEFEDSRRLSMGNPQNMMENMQKLLRPNARRR
jgi:hypothetical protein